MDQTLGEIRLVAFARIPQGWHLCDGSELPISGNEGLFSVIGTTYGGDGVQNFGLPDLRGRAAAGFGQGADLPNYTLGQKVGTETVVLTVGNLPSHTHTMSCNGDSDSATTNDPGGGYPATGPISVSGSPVNTRFVPAADGSVMNAESVGAAGSSGPVSNMQPVLVLNYIIAITGTYPQKPN